MIIIRLKKMVKGEYEITTRYILAIEAGHCKICKNLTNAMVKSPGHDQHMPKKL